MARLVLGDKRDGVLRRRLVATQERSHTPIQLYPNSLEWRAFARRHLLGQQSDHRRDRESRRLGTACGRLAYQRRTSSSSLELLCRNRVFHVRASDDRSHRGCVARAPALARIRYLAMYATSTQRLSGLELARSTSRDRRVRHRGRICMEIHARSPVAVVGLLRRQLNTVSAWRTAHRHRRADMALLLVSHSGPPGP